MPRAVLSEKLQDVISNAEVEDDLATIEKLLTEGFEEADQAALPYSAPIAMTKEFRQAYYRAKSDGGVEGFGAVSSVAVAAANALSGARRRIKYRRKVHSGFEGIRLVEDGDSWTQYPWRLKDITDQLADRSDLAVYSVGAAGDLVVNIAKEKEYLDALEKTGAPGLIISGAGNDIFGDFGALLKRFQVDKSPAEHIDDARFNPIFDVIVASYHTILGDVANAFPEVTVFGHGYDLPFPEEDGSWMGPDLKEKGIPLDFGRKIIAELMKRYNDMLADLSGQNSNFVYTDMRGVVGNSSRSWHDELHPKNEGFERVAKAMEAVIRQTITASQYEQFEAEETEGTDSQFEHHTARNRRLIVLDPGHGGPKVPPKIGGSSWNNAIGPNGTLEKTLTLDVAKRTKSILEDRGFSVLMTRETDVNRGLKSRAGVAKSSKAGVFVSIHFNALRGGSAQGTETFVHSQLTSASSGLASKALCRLVQAEMVAALGLRDRNSLHPGGIKYGSFGVLRPSYHASITASVLHEVSFLDEADEERRLNRVSYRRKIAMALADGIESYVDSVSPAAEIFVAEHEFEDAIEAAEFTTQTVGAQVHQPFAQPYTHLSAPALTKDISNGNMLASDRDTELMALARHEAEFIEAGPVRSEAWDSGDEGDEPNEYDPDVERAFSNMSVDPEANFSFLQDLFGSTLGAAAHQFETTSSINFDLADFQRHIGALELRHFSATEFLVKGASNKPGGKGAGLNTNPPRSLWRKMNNTALMLDEIRRRLGAPIYLLSAYRSPAYNEAIDGAEHSRHMKFDAIDWYSTQGSVHDWVAVAQEVANSNPSAFRGWMKAYTGGNFVHIDTRHRSVTL